MRDKNDAMKWIPLWCDKWLFGSTRIELQPDERSVFIDLLALASKDSGHIRANPQTEYPISQLAGLLCVSEELLKRSLQRFEETGKLRRNDNGVGYYIVNWGEYQLTERHKRRFVESRIQMSAKTDTMSEKRDTMSSKAVPREEKRREEERIGNSENFEKKSKIKNLIHSLSKEKDLDQKADLSGRREFLRRQAKELGVGDER